MSVAPVPPVPLPPSPASSPASSPSLPLALEPGIRHEQLFHADLRIVELHAHLEVAARARDRPPHPAAEFAVAHPLARDVARHVLRYVHVPIHGERRPCRAARRRGARGPGPVPQRGRAALVQRRRGHRLEKARRLRQDRKSTRLNSSHGYISYAVFCLKKKKKKKDA